MKEQIISKKTESILTEYLKFTGKDRISIAFTDFISARELAKEEITSGLFSEEEQNEKAQVPIDKRTSPIYQPENMNKKAPIQEPDYQDIDDGFPKEELQNEETQEKKMSQFEILRSIKDEWN